MGVQYQIAAVPFNGCAKEEVHVDTLHPHTFCYKACMGCAIRCLCFVCLCLPSTGPVLADGCLGCCFRSSTHHFAFKSTFFSENLEVLS